MNKIKTIAIAIFLSSLATLASAEWRAGINGVGVTLDDVKGQETTSTETRSETLEAMYASVFVEKDLGPIAIGLDVIPYNIESETNTNERTNDAVDSGTNSVQVDIETHATLYAILGLGDSPAYIKAGMSYANLATNESMATSSKYDDADLEGYHLSLGVQRELDNAFVRLEAGYSSYDDVSITATGDGANPNKVTVSGMEGPHARISIGKSF